MPVDLQAFCSKEPDRPYLHKPFSRGEWSYATDGRVMVRVPRRADVPPNANAPATEKLFADNQASGLRPFGKVELPEEKTEKVDCEDCNGRGYDHDCPDCRCECQECGGEGEVEKLEDVSVNIGGVPFAARYVRLIQKLPNLRVTTAVKPKLPMPFAFDGGDGLLMPLSWAKGTHISEAREKAAS